jgi:uncharacterized protein involved in high-affinity Fe2+ transport
MISVLAQTHTTIVRGQMYHPLKADDITHQGNTLWMQVTLGEDIIFKIIRCWLLPYRHVVDE